MVTNIETGFMPPIEELASTGTNFTPQQVAIFECRAMGLSRAETAKLLNISDNTARGYIADCLDRSETGPAEIIQTLLAQGRIDKAKLSESFDFPKYELLSEGEIELAKFASNQENLTKSRAELARELSLRDVTIKNRLVAVYNKLGIRSLLGLRVFMMLKLEQDAQLEDADGSDVSPEVASFDELRVWGLKAYAHVQRAKRRRLSAKVG